MSIKPTKVNIQLGHMGEGYLDPKIGAKNLTELAEIETVYAGYLVEGQVTWVMSENSWYRWNGTTFAALSMKGDPGDAGPPGDPGNSFKIDAECSSTSCLTTNYCQEAKGFAVLVTESGQGGDVTELLYFKLTDASSSCTSADWSTGTPFNTGVDGDDGTSSHSIFAAALPSEIINGTPTDSEVVINSEGAPTMPYTKGGVLWTDSPRQVTGDERMYILKSENYKINVFTHVPWQQPAVYIDGDEGKSAGMWSVWNDKTDGMPADPPFDDTKMNTSEELRALLYNTGWYDDVSDKNMDGTADDPGKPIWMANSYLTPDTQVWKPWAVTRVAGEKPEYLINAFIWASSVTAPSAPTVSSITYGDTGSVLFPDPESSGWRDAPGANPSSGTLELWQTFTKVPFTGADKEAITWSAPLNIEGKEGPQGDGTAIWVIWTDVENPSIVVPLVGAHDAYQTDQDIQDYLNANNNTDWTADAGSNSVTYSATCMYVPGTGWSVWKTARVKGEDGTAFKVENTGSVDPWVWAAGKCGTLANGINYLDTANSLLYFLEDNVKCDLEEGWSAPSAFGTGLAGATTYFYFKRSDTGAPAAPSNPPATPGETPVEGWTDGVPAGAGVVYTSSIVHEPPVTWKPWTTPIPIEGVDGAEGAGIWTIFTKTETLAMLADTIPLPQGNPGSWSFTTGNTDEWIDDVGTNNSNLGGESPKWMAISRYDVTNTKWLPWALSMVKGEEPAYKVNAYKNYYGGDNNADEIPTKPAQTIAYGKGFVAENGWTDGPVASSDASKSLFMSEYVVSTTSTGMWSAPAKMDAGDGYGTKTWGIWFAQNNNGDVVTLPMLGDPNSMITSNSTGLGTISDLPCDTQGAWVDSVSDAPGKFITYQAVTNYVKFLWTPWDIIKVKGENGTKGEDGTAGGTIVMINPVFSLGSSLTPAHPSVYGKGDDPKITAEDVELMEPANTWQANVASGEDAVHLAIMSFGYDATTGGSSWSQWRVTRIKGTDSGWDQVTNITQSEASSFTVKLSWDLPQELVPSSYSIKGGDHEYHTTNKFQVVWVPFGGGTALYEIRCIAGADIYSPAMVLAAGKAENPVKSVTITPLGSSGDPCSKPRETRYIRQAGVMIPIGAGTQFYTDAEATVPWTGASVAGNHAWKGGLTVSKGVLNSDGVVTSVIGNCPSDPPPHL